ncbi:hypothetical protein X975_03887, partial [Stegodyphus mimosarum]
MTPVLYPNCTIPRTAAKMAKTRLHVRPSGQLLQQEVLPRNILPLSSNTGLSTLCISLGGLRPLFQRDTEGVLCPAEQTPAAPSHIHYRTSMRVICVSIGSQHVHTDQTFSTPSLHSRVNRTVSQIQIME